MSWELKGKPQYHYRVINPEDMLEAAEKKAKDLGVNAAIIASSPDDIGTRPFKKALASIAVDIEVYSRPFNPLYAPIAGGEILVKTLETSWKGGRNLEFALSAAPMIERSEKIIITSADSDGTDGPHRYYPQHC
jgi:hydroxypyruvate reductase